MSCCRTTYGAYGFLESISSVSSQISVPFRMYSPFSPSVFSFEPVPISGTDAQCINSTSGLFSIPSYRANSFSLSAVIVYILSLEWRSRDGHVYLVDSLALDFRMKRLSSVLRNWRQSYLRFESRIKLYLSSFAMTSSRCSLVQRRSVRELPRNLCPRKKGIVGISTPLSNSWCRILD